ncbi:amidohydrolase family protein [Streptomyces sp. NBC_00201]|uniref:amidohydrolase family protein n=1 Tax=unclassified Streptomyces TaxID=2593676 RepID=UPI002250B75F|nr:MULTISPECIES: amidohydrolase family protein [unclassified Streptomyces]MCX5063121.1 amidohydrolase family protein [Streptomyces sp. NBC_00452]MCX5250961.1 amidohydrolase family protein [Streptomyces sp. NBC_00201]MCX5291110.1 amidohydrolase family protein [Streptomyces sp. NBC_00183]
MTVDAHHHVWDLSVRDQSWIPELSPLRRNFTLTDLVPEARAAGVDRTVLVQTVTVPEETPEFLELAASHDLIAGVVGWTDLTRPDIAEELARLRELPGGRHLKGIRHQVQGEADPQWLLRPDVLRGLAAVAEAGLVHDLVVLPHQLPACAEAAATLPQLAFVLDHLGKPPIASGALKPWAPDLHALAALPNTYAKLSGLITEADPDSWSVEDLRPYTETALEAFGPHRLMFGSDWPVCTATATYGEVLSLTRELTRGLDAEERADVFDGTATRVYGL